MSSEPTSSGTEGAPPGVEQEVDPLQAQFDLLVANAPNADLLKGIREQIGEWARSYLDWHENMRRDLFAAAKSRADNVITGLEAVGDDEVVALYQRERPQIPPVPSAYLRKMRIVERQLREFIDSLDLACELMGEGERLLDHAFLILIDSAGAVHAEVERLIKMVEVGAESMGFEIHNPEDETPAAQVALLARSGRSDQQIARILGCLFPAWRRSAEEYVGVSAELSPATQRLQAQAVTNLLIDRVRKMRRERHIPAGTKIRSGTVDRWHSTGVDIAKTGSSGGNE